MFIFNDPATTEISTYFHTLSLHDALPFFARVVGENKAREIWYLCRRYTAREALAMGLVNTVVPDDELDAEVARWCQEICERSPTAIAIAKRSFNADTESIRGIGALGRSEERREGKKCVSTCSSRWSPYH